jgi:hypothetical protein
MQNKTVCVFSGHGAMKYIRLGQGRALQAAGYNVVFYDPDNQNIPVLDLFKRLDQQNLSVVVLGSYQLNRPLLKALLARPHLQLILFTPNYSDWEMPKEVLCANDNEVKMVEQLKTVMNGLDSCFTYYSHEWLDATHSKWRNIGLEPRSSLLAADLNDYSFGNKVDALACDVGWVGGWWDYKAQNLKQYLLPLCGGNLNVKLFGYGGFPVAENLGTIQDGNVKHLYASAKISPSIYEPLADLGFDISERIYKIMSCGGFCVSQPHKGLKPALPNGSYVESESPEDFIEKVNHYVANPSERLPFIREGVKYAYTEGNYFARVRNILELIGDINGAMNLDKVLEQVRSIGGDYVNTRLV